MPRIDDIRMPGGMSMNLDVDLSLMPENAYREAYNMRNGSSASNNLGGMEALKGNTLRWELTQLSQQTRIIGRYVDPASNSIFFFATTTPPLTGHFIMRYYYDTGNLQLIFSDPILNFSLSHPVNHIDLVDGKILYWTDGYNPPRKLNVDKAYNYTNNVNVSALKRYFKNVARSDSRVTAILDQIIHPPLYSPTKFTGTDSGISFSDGYGTDSDYKYNSIIKSLWQFRYRYVYDDHYKSVWSSCSKVFYDNASGLSVGTFHSNQCIGNVIGLIINTGKEEVVYIEIAARTDRTGKWNLIDRIQKYNEDGDVIVNSEIDYLYKFYNNTQGESLDQLEVNRDFHLVPKIAVAETIIEKNRLVYGNILEGYDGVSLDINMKLKFNKKYPVPYSNVIQCIVNVASEWTVMMPEVPYVDGVYFVIISDTEPSLDLSWYAKVICEEGDTAIDMKYKMIAALDALDFVYIGNYTIEVIITQQTIIGHPTWFKMRIIPTSHFGTLVTGIVYLNFENYSSYKAGSWCEFGLRYFDRGGRGCSLITNDDCKLFIPYYPTLCGDGSLSLEGMLHQILIDWEINHKPPEFATHYKWYRKNNSIEYFVDLPLFEKDIRTIGIDTYLIITPYVSDVKRLWKNNILEPWVWQPGDRIRFYGAKRLNTPVGYYNYLTVEHDYEIVGMDYSVYDVDNKGYAKDDMGDDIYDEHGNKVRDEWKQSFVIQNFKIPFTKKKDVEYVYFVEIYRKRKEIVDDAELWYEFGEEYPVLNPGTEQRLHGKGADDGTGWAKDQKEGSSARGSFLTGNIYLKVREFFNVSASYGNQWFSFPAESQWFSDFFVSNLNDDGKVSVINKEYRERWFPTTLRYGGLYIQESYVNELTAIIGGDLEILSEKYGEITLLKESGYTLKVRCANKIVSLYIGRAGLQQAEVAAEGGEVVVASDRILGTQWITNQIYGCIRPESEVTHGNDSYFVDIYNGHIIRESKNGLLSVSNAYGLRDWTKTVCEYLTTYCENIRIVGGYNESHGELWYTFYGTLKTNGSVYQKTLIMFDPETSDAKGFKSFVEYTDAQGYPPDTYAAAGMRFFVALKGSLYEQDTNELRCNFFGEQRYPSILLVFNKQVNMEKVFKVLQYDGEQEWHCPTAGDIKIPASYGQREMMSVLDIQRIKNIKGIKYGYFGRNMLTTTDKPNTLDLMNGEELRGRLLLINLVGRNPDKSFLRWVKVESVISMLTG